MVSNYRSIKSLYQEYTISESVFPVLLWMAYWLLQSIPESEDEYLWGEPMWTSEPAVLFVPQQKCAKFLVIHECHTCPSLVYAWRSRECARFARHKWRKSAPPGYLKLVEISLLRILKYNQGIGSKGLNSFLVCGHFPLECSKLFNCVLLTTWSGMLVYLKAPSLNSGLPLSILVPLSHLKHERHFKICFKSCFYVQCWVLSCFCLFASWWNPCAKSWEREIQNKLWKYFIVCHHQIKTSEKM